MVKATEVGSLFAGYLDEGVISSNEVLAEGTFMEDKNALVDVRFLITEWNHRKGQAGDNVEVSAILTNDERVSFVDFSTGIRLQLEDMTRKMRSQGANDTVEYGKVVPPKPILCTHGLRVSNYSYHDELEGKSHNVQTFYLDSAK